VAVGQVVRAMHRFCLLHDKLVFADWLTVNWWCAEGVRMHTVNGQRCEVKKALPRDDQGLMSSKRTGKWQEFQTHCVLLHNWSPLYTLDQQWLWLLNILALHWPCWVV